MQVDVSSECMPSLPVVLLPTLSALTFDYETNVLAAQDLVVAPNQIPFTPSKNAAVRIRIMLQFRRQCNRLRQLCRIKFHHSVSVGTALYNQDSHQSTELSVDCARRNVNGTLYSVERF